MKYFIIFVFAMLCVFGCGDEGIENTLHGLSAPTAPTVVITSVPPEIQTLLWGDWDTLLYQINPICSARSLCLAMLT